MVESLEIRPTAVYDDGAITLTLGISAECLAIARRSGSLRFTRKGRRVLYLGQWLIDWLESTPVAEGGHAK